MYSPTVLQLACTFSPGTVARMAADPTPEMVELADMLRTAVGDLVRATREHDARSPAASAVLGLLDREGPATVAELAARRRVRHQSLTATVAELWAADLVTTRPHPDDGRKKLIALTARGRRVIRSDRRARTDRLAQAVAALTDRERRQLAAANRLLERMTATVRGEDQAGYRRGV
jgi:DNA-binding MarR family transcriptional regulator